MELAKAFVAELLGTFILVLAGCSVVAAEGAYLAIALAFGLILAALCYIFVSYSSYFNPALTVIDMSRGVITGTGGALLISGQLVGAFFAAIMVMWFFGNSGAALGKLSTTEVFKAFIVEALFSFVLGVVFVFLPPAGPYNGIILGLTLAVGVLAALPLTGGSLNPARAFGPAFFNSQAAPVYWLYLLGPLLGGGGAVLLYQCYQHYWTSSPPQEDLVCFTSLCVASPPAEESPLPPSPPRDCFRSTLGQPSPVVFTVPPVASAVPLPGA